MILKGTLQVEANAYRWATDEVFVDRNIIFIFYLLFQRYDWTKKNDFFMRGSADYFQIGGQR